MYLGHLVELAESLELCRNPLHPYTKALLSAVPIPDPKVTRGRKRDILKGEIPNPMEMPQGCPFSTLCPQACEPCVKTVPELKDFSPEHKVACYCAGDMRHIDILDT
jgi:oligopeptide transport system ATP-binding protein